MMFGHTETDPTALTWDDLITDKVDQQRSADSEIQCRNIFYISMSGKMTGKSNERIQ